MLASQRDRLRYATSCFVAPILLCGLQRDVCCGSSLALARGFALYDMPVGYRCIPVHMINTTVDHTSMFFIMCVRQQTYIKCPHIRRRFRGHGPRMRFDDLAAQFGELAAPLLLPPLSSFHEAPTGRSCVCLARCALA